MILKKYSTLPNFPFERYFEVVNEYIHAQEYWLNVLRSSERFETGEWQPVSKPVNLQDDMYTGLVADVENVKDRKIIKIYTTSLPGRSNFILKEDLETAELMDTRAFEDDLSSEMYDSYDELVASGLLAKPVKTLEEALKKVRLEFKQTNAFEAGVGRRDFYDETEENSSSGPYVYGEELSIISTITPENEQNAMQALELFLLSGPAMDRVNRVFAPDEE